MNRILLGFFIGLVLVAGVGRAMVRMHHSAQNAVVTNCTTSGLAAYASGNHDRFEAAIASAVSGDEPDLAIACKSD